MSRRRVGLERCSRLSLLVLAGLFGCGELGGNPTLAGGHRSALHSVRPNSSLHADSTPRAPLNSAGASGADAVTGSDSGESPARSSQEQAAIEALRASRQAHDAAEAAAKASQQAAEASKQATQAAARAGIGTSAVEPPAPAVVLSSADPVTGEKDRARTLELVQGIDQSIEKIDPAKLNRDDAQRMDLAERLLQSAQKALGQGDYNAAHSLAMKASIMLAPLVRTEDSAR
jgi:hypothetical protein